MAAPHATTCAACGASGELHEHHLVPRVDGGSMLPTVLLCLACHGQVHGRSFGTRHAEMTRRGLAAAKARGVILGNPNLRTQPGNAAVAALARKARAANAAARAADILPYIAAAQKAGCRTLLEIGQALTARGVKTPAGRADWSPEQVRRILAKGG